MTASAKAINNCAACTKCHLLTLVAAQDRRVLRVLLDVLDGVNPVRDLAEEGVVVREAVDGLVVIAGLAHVEDRLLVRVDEAQAIAVRVHFELARVVVALERGEVRERADGAALVFPGRGGDTGDAVLRRDRALVDGDLCGAM